MALASTSSMTSWWGRSQPPRRPKYTSTTPRVMYQNVMFAACGHCAPARRRRSISRRHGEVVEVHVAVGLGPQADSSRNRLGQDMLQVKLAVEIGRDLGPGDADLKVVPLAGRGPGNADPFRRGPCAFPEFPTTQIGS